MPSVPKLGFKGLKTSGNPLTYPPGSLNVADDVVMLTRDVMEPRRAHRLYTPRFGTTQVIARAITQWREHTVIHYGANQAGTTVSIDSSVGSGPWVDIDTVASASYQSVTGGGTNNPRMKFAQSNTNLYYTSASGLRVFETPTSTAAKQAGRPRPFDFLNVGAALGVTFTGNPNASGTWMPTNNAVAYRAVIGRKDANGNVKLGAPNGRIVLINGADYAVPVGGLSNSGTTVTATLANGHNFNSGDIVALSPGEANFPAGNYTITAITSTTITWTAGAVGAVVSTAIETISSGTKNVQVVISFGYAVPALFLDVVVGDFVQLYRTNTSGGAAIDPGDECFLCYERTITATDYANGYVTISDTTPNSALGTPLYSNQNTGNGTAQEHEKPPMMTDLVNFDSRLWGANTTDVHRLLITMIGVGSPNGIVTNDTLAIGNVVYFFTAITQFLPSRNIHDTAMALLGRSYQKTSSLPGDTHRTGRLLDPGDSIVAQMLFEDTALGGSTFYAATSRVSAFSSPLANLYAVTEASSSRTGSTVTVTTATAHDFATGDSVVLAVEQGSSVDANFPAGVKTPITKTGASTFTYSEAGAAATMSSVYYAYKATYGSTAGTKPLRFTPQFEPEAWPLLNYIGGLPDGAIVKRILPLQGMLFVFLEHGDIYTVAGTYPYSVQKFDGTASLIGADTLVEHAGRLYGLTTQGPVAISPTGVQVLDLDIERDLRISLTNHTHYDSAGFAVSYESDRQYQLWLPTTSSSYICGEAYVYQSDSQTWEHWTGQRTCGLLYARSNAMFYGDGRTWTDSVNSWGQLLGEAKLYTRDDYGDYGITVNGTFAAGVVTLATVAWAGLVTANDILIDTANAVSYIIVTAAAGTGIITLTGSGAAPDGARSVELRSKAVPTVEWVIDAGGQPGLEKQFREVQLHFSFCLAETLAVTFSNEKSMTTTHAVGVTVPATDGGGGNVTLATTSGSFITLRVSVPDEMQRCAQLRVRVAGVVAQDYFRFLGATATAEPTSERTGQ